MRDDQPRDSDRLDFVIAGAQGIVAEDLRQSIEGWLGDRSIVSVPNPQAAVLIVSRLKQGGTVMYFADGPGSGAGAALAPIVAELGGALVFVNGERAPDGLPGRNFALPMPFSDQSVGQLLRDLGEIPDPN